MSIHAQRLLNVALACRESPSPDRFHMGNDVHHKCGTPACAMGNYAARTDLQDFCSIREINVAGEPFFEMWIGESRAFCFWDSEENCSYFGITPTEGYALFYARGCGDAKTPNQAAEYIERFVARKWGIDPAVRKLEAALTDAQPERVLCP